MAREWLLLETFSDEPTVITVGNQPRNMVPLGVFLRRNRHLAVIRRAVAAAVNTGKPLFVGPNVSDIVIDIRPVAMPDGHLHGVWLWAGSAAPESDPPDIAGPSVLNADTGMFVTSPASRRALGIGDSQPETVSVAELYRYIAPNPGETDALGLIVTATEGMSYCATWPGRDEDGMPTLMHFYSRVVIEPNSRGEPERLARAISIRVGTPSEPVSLLEEQLLEASAEPGSFRALVAPTTRVLMKWIDPPPPELHWQFDPQDRPKIHPDDQANANFILDNILHGNAEVILRFRRHDDGWMRLHATACPLTVDHDATLALVTFTCLPDEDS